jgi:GTP-binding protein Era
LRAGFVSILGRPNAGKSTLVNSLTGEKVAIVTSKPQTTRARIHGVVEVPKSSKHPAAQIVFVDTPGVHKPTTLLDKRMMQVVYDALESRDVVLLMVDASRRLELEEIEVAQPAIAVVDADTGLIDRPKKKAQSEDAFVFELVRKLDCPVFLVLNKIDLVPRAELLPIVTRLSAIRDFAEVVMISAKTGDGTDRLTELLVNYLPEGQRYFPEDQFTDQPERFLVAELIRERILTETGEEVPYASAVVIEQFEEPPPPPKGKQLTRLPLTRIAAAIYCERDGQKAILIGKGGAKLKSIGAGARLEIEKLLGTRVYLELHIIVEPNWRERRGFLDTLDWRRQLEDLAARPSSSELDLPDAAGSAESKATRDS